MRFGLVLFPLLLLAMPLSAQEMTPEHHATTATARLLDVDGREVGEVRLEETPFHGVLVTVEVSGLSAGPHALHIHETGRCETPSFGSAGGHYAPRGQAHGARTVHGKHAGDLLNLHVPASGDVKVEQQAADVTLHPHAPHSLFDDDGSAVVIHAGADDYESQPSGAAGDRVACGIIRR